MLNEVKWNDRYNTNVDIIDKAHQKLFSIVGKLITLNEDETKQLHACKEGIKYFKSYTLKHFAEEEAYMQSIHYDGFELHKALHDDLKDKTIPALEKEMEEQEYSRESVEHFLGICVGWLNVHITVEDQAITGRAVNKWIHRPSEDMLTSLKKASMQVLENFFKLSVGIVSERYSGESFSSENILCFRLSYHNGAGERLQVFLAYEERMVLHVLSSVIGKQIPKVDKTVIHAIKMISQQFMTCVGKHFAQEDGYLLDRNDMLTFDQLLRTFDKEYPPYSLLFNTDGNGYMALCIRHFDAV